VLPSHIFGSKLSNNTCTITDVLLNSLLGGILSLFLGVFQEHNSLSGFGISIFFQITLIIQIWQKLSADFSYFFRFWEITYAPLET
jgi:hypothetical protein